MWFIFFNILWLIICDIEICFSFKWLFMMQLLVSFEFYIKNIYLLVFFYIYFFILIKFEKQIDMIDLFNKWVVLGLKNLDSFNKHVRLVLTHIVGYLWVDTTRPDTRTRIATPNVIRVSARDWSIEVVLLMLAWVIKHIRH